MDPEPAPPAQPAQSPEGIEADPPQTEPQPTILETPVEEPPPSPEVFDSEAQTRGATEGQTIQEPAAPLASQPAQPTQPTLKSFLGKALESIRFRKKAKLEKIMKLADEKRSITNDQVQKLLRVSDATATRYLSTLVRQGRLKQLGVRASTRYEPTLGSIPTV